MTGADFAHARPVVVRRIKDTASPVDRFADKGRNRTGAFPDDRLLEFAGRCLPHGLARLRPLKSVWITRLDVNETRDSRFKHFPVSTHGCGAHRLQRDSVVSLVTCDELHLLWFSSRLPVEPRGLQGRL